jgi:hypothetical protein
VNAGATRVERFVALLVGHPAAFARAGLMQRVRWYNILVLLLHGVAEALRRARDRFAQRHFTRDAQQVAHWIDHFGVPGRLTAGLNYCRANVKVALRRDWPAGALPVIGDAMPMWP